MTYIFSYFSFFAYVISPWKFLDIILHLTKSDSLFKVKGTRTYDLKYASLAYGLLWAEGNWEPADPEKALYLPWTALKNNA